MQQDSGTGGVQRNRKSHRPTQRGAPLFLVKKLFSRHGP